MISAIATNQQVQCFHCGEDCRNDRIRSAEKIFCCEGCKMVYQILQANNLCGYYDLNASPGITQRIPVRKEKFAFLDNRNIQDQLISFRDEQQVRITFYLPQMHCSSCLYLLENLHKLDPGVISSKVNFTRKETDVVLSASTSVRQLAELLTSIGYEPYISLNDLKEKRPGINKQLIYRVGVAGFCFGNIMLMSFPEYLGIDSSETALLTLFRWINFGLSVPVLFYSSYPFFESSWKSLKHKFLNIDAPIALAILITFIRSAWEVISGTGGGYFDSMTGIVFFMLAGRILQDKTYRQLSFERDYSSYFPIAVSVMKNDQEVPTALPDIQPGDTLLIHHEELIPADGILTRGKAFIDYSFVTGESLPVLKEMGEIIYAGGRQTEGNIELLVVKEVTQSYLTKLWNREELKKGNKTESISFVHLLSRYFTYIVFAIAAITAVYWSTHDYSRLWPAITAIFIIACPCALLLSNTFTNGNILRILGRNHFYLRNAQVIEDIAKTSHIVFDKTGTLTTTLEQQIAYEGSKLTAEQNEQVAALAACSSHPLSRALVRFLHPGKKMAVDSFEEVTGKGISGTVEQHLVRLGSYEFVTGDSVRKPGTSVFLSFDNRLTGYFLFSNHYRKPVPGLVNQLRKHYRLSVLSGDNDHERKNLEQMLGQKANLLFQQGPEDKLNYIQQLQEAGEKVMMVGDGLNDAGALKQSDTGIAVAEQTNSFTPASDAIMEARQLSLLPKFIRLCRFNRKIVIASFVLSILYNIIGLYFAVQGILSPLIAAILMPSSSLSILLITFGSSSYVARRQGL